MMDKVGRKTGLTDFRVNVPRGVRTFRWIYSKDYSGTSGKDKAKIQLLEVVGTEFADLQCRSCRGARGHGAAACAVCAKDEYLEVTEEASAGTASEQLNRCHRCPLGHWALPSSV